MNRGEFGTDPNAMVAQGAGQKAFARRGKLNGFATTRAHPSKNAQEKNAQEAA